MSPIGSILEKLFEMRAIHRELNTSIRPTFKKWRGKSPPEHGEKRVGPGKEQKGHAGDGASVSPSAYASRVALLYQNLLMLRINRSHPAQ